MANTRQSGKRARAADKRQKENQVHRTTSRSAVKMALDAIKSGDVAKVKEAYQNAISTLAKTASKKALPKGRAARKTSRLTKLIKKTLPQVFSAK